MTELTKQARELLVRYEIVLKRDDPITYGALIKDSNTIINDLLAELDKHKWISVDDVLPDKRCDCLGVRTKQKGNPVGYYFYHDKYFYRNGFKDNQVTHWMPLPEPPKENDDALFTQVKQELGE